MTDRLLIPKTSSGNQILFYTAAGSLIATGYKRVVIGERGAYVEFAERHIQKNNIAVPEDQSWRFRHPKCFYIEYRSKDPSWIKLYYQIKPVDYADYLVGFWYIAPKDLQSNVYPKLIQEAQIELPL